MSGRSSVVLSDNALRVLKSRYLRRDEHRTVIETPEEMFARVARAVAQGELAFGGQVAASRWEEAFGRMLTALDFLPNSPTLMNAGTPLGQLSACFVIPVLDTTEGIFEAVKQMALVQRTGGGTGFSFSRLRPRGDLVASTGGESSGPVSFMHVFDCTTEHIKQGGRRRGANMGVMRVDHPDVLEFVQAKLSGQALQNFNVSVAATDAFMEAVRDDRGFDLIHPNSGRAVRSVRARDLFAAIVEAAHRIGDPGLLFYDAINRANPTPEAGPLEATNPCGEIPLLPYESCNLGSINLARMIRREGAGAVLDWEKLSGVTRTAVRFLDDVIEINRYPIPDIERMTRNTRKVGLGLMGFAEALIRLGISYDSEAAELLAGRIMQEVSREAWQTSRELAVERGVFPGFAGSVHAARRDQVRNATTTAIAPTGTIGIIADTSSGIEPIFALAYRRERVLEGNTLFEVNRLFREIIATAGLDAEGVAAEVLRQGRLSAVSQVPAGIRDLFVTALDVSSERQLRIQAAFQRSVDNSVSKTINLPAESTREDVAQAFMRAWELGLKGVTVYRYGSRSEQVLLLGADEGSDRLEHGAKCDPDECKL